MGAFRIKDTIDTIGNFLNGNWSHKGRWRKFSDKRRRLKNGVACKNDGHFLLHEFFLSKNSLNFT